MQPSPEQGSPGLRSYDAVDVLAGVLLEVANGSVGHRSKHAVDRSDLVALVGEGLLDLLDAGFRFRAFLGARARVGRHRRRASSSGCLRGLGA